MMTIEHWQMIVGLLLGVSVGLGVALWGEFRRGNNLMEEKESDGRWYREKVEIERKVAAELAAKNVRLSEEISERDVRIGEIDNELVNARRGCDSYKAVAWERREAVSRMEQRVTECHKAIEKAIEARDAFKTHADDAEKRLVAYETDSVVLCTSLIALCQQFIIKHQVEESDGTGSGEGTGELPRGEEATRNMHICVRDRGDA